MRPKMKAPTGRRAKVRVTATVTAVMYFAINFGLSLLSRRLEISPEDRIAAEAGTVAARPVLVRPA